MKSLPDSIPRSVVALVWALAALHWRSGKRFAGATYTGVRALLGQRTAGGMRALVKQAEESGAVVVIRSKRPPLILLTHTTLQRLEDLWRT